ncbi:MAG: SPOR domain-containing protein [Geminicoccaceae bacterium]|nr:SPOR domain-containing protein [Geminicoccaceae bacterium]
MASIHETLGASGSEVPKVVAEDPPRRGFARRFALPFAFLAVFGLFALVVVGAWQDHLAPAGEPPLVRAPPGPIKRPPDTPGAVDTQSEGAAALAAGQPPPPRIERILPRDPPPPKTLAEADPGLVAPPPASAAPTEAANPALPHGLGASIAGANGPARATAATALAEGPGEAYTPPANTAPPPAAASSPAPAPLPVAGRAGAESGAARAPSANASAPAGTARASGPAGPWGVQIAAVSSREAAERGWRALLARYPDVLGPLQPRVEELRLANGSTLYRLQGVGLGDREAAARVCARLRAGGEQCFVVGAR